MTPYFRIAVIVAASLLLAMRSETAIAESSSSVAAPVAGHVVRESGVPLVASSGTRTMSYPIVTFGDGGATAPDDFDALPRCGRGGARREEIYGIAPQKGMFDILFYDPDDSLQRERRTQFNGRTAPYIESAMSNPYSPPSVVQAFARTLGLRCLPTHIGLVSVDGRAYIEYREGDAAWAAGR